MRIGVLILVYLSVCTIAVRHGSVFLPWNEFVLSEPIVQLRIYRVVTGTVVGALLALSGSVLQHLLRNPIVDGHVLGITSAGTFGALATIIVFGTAAFSLQIIGALVFSLLCVAFVLFVQSQRTWGEETLALPLVGLLINAFFGSLTMLFFVFASPGQLSQAYAWLLGSLHPMDSWPVASIAFALSLVGLGVVQMLQTTLVVAQFGDKFTLSLGYRLPLVRWISLIAVCMFSTIVVLFSGSVGFVGLLVPHFVRACFKNSSVHVVANGLCGAIFVVLADFFARWMFAPSEIPVGVLTALMGVPAFGWILLRRRT